MISGRGKFEVTQGLVNASYSKGVLRAVSHDLAAHGEGAWFERKEARG